MNSSDEPTPARVDDEDLKFEDMIQEMAAISVANDHPDPSTISAEILDPKGDLKLKIKDVVFLVSSNVLTLASSYFRTMLQENTFSEGVEQPRVTHSPIKELSESDPESFYLMLKLLHFQKCSPPDEVDELESLANVCDYYDTVQALSTHAQAWVRPYLDKAARLEDSDLGKLIWITYVFDLEDGFSIFTREYAANLATEEWGNMSLRMMPDALEGDILRLRQSIQCYIGDEIEKVIDDLRGDNRRYEMVGYVICDQCFLHKPLETKKCGTCKGRDFSKDHCSRWKRIEILFEWLEKSGLWPTAARRVKSNRMMATTTRSDRHSCTAEMGCPYYSATARLAAEVEDARMQVKGLRLRDYRASSS